MIDVDNWKEKIDSIPHVPRNRIAELAGIGEDTVCKAMRGANEMSHKNAIAVSYAILAEECLTKLAKAGMLSGAAYQLESMVRRVGGGA